jgi:hypothetical protein
MKTIYLSVKNKCFSLLVLILLGCASIPATLRADIWVPEGINLPGGWNNWSNPPYGNLALASSTQVSGGRVTKITTGTPRWQTWFHVAASGGDMTGGSYPFLFTSGPVGNPWSNTWKNVTVSMNTLQTYTFQGTSDNQITVVNGKWYTMNWKDSGYANTQAVFLETSAQPVNISTVVVPASASAGTPVIVSVTTSAVPCPEEVFYVRYSTNAWQSSTVLAISMNGSSGSVAIPAQSAGTQLSCYVFSSTIPGIVSDFDMLSLKINDNSGSFYSTLIGSSLLSVTTASVSGITSNAAVSGGIISSGGQTILARGVCWSTTAEPDLSDNFTTDGSGEGAFTSQLSSLSSGTLYYVRAYATTASGTTYGSPVQFNTLFPVNFMVDMSTAQGFIPGTDLVYLAGSFPAANWSEPGTNPAMLMTPLSSGSLTYTLTLSLPAGTYEFKHFKNAGWTGGEWSGGSNRSVAVSSGTALLNTWGGEISWANLQWPPNGSINQGDPLMVYARVNIPNGRTGVSGGAYGVSGWIGYSTTNTNPATWTHWIPASFNAVAGSNDEYFADAGSAIPDAGVYYLASRFRAGTGAYYYGGFNSGFWDGNLNVSSVVTINPVVTEKTLNLKLFIEGLYAGNGLMNKARNATAEQYSDNICDKISVELHDPSDYSALVYTAGDISLNTNGSAVLTGIPSGLSGSYFITIRHRNSIAITSASPVSLVSQQTSYDFSSSASRAFGSNQKNISGVFCLYTGDVNQDGSINAQDKLLTTSAANGFQKGYLVTDVNGDGLINLKDLVLVDNNEALQIGVQFP